MLTYFILAFFACAAVANLVGNWIENHRLCGITKPMLVSLLLLYYLSGGAPGTSVLLICALAASWLGDVLLMLKGTAWFVAGGISFGCAHILLVIAFAQSADLTAVPVWSVILLSAVYVAATGFVVFRVRGSAPGILLSPIGLYLLCNGTMNLFVFIRMLSAPGAGTVLTCVGAVLFFVSDCVLLLVRFRKVGIGRINPNFIIMLTYISGIYLIVQGVLLSG